MSLKDELKRIDEFFDNMSIEEFDDMLVRNGIEDDKYKMDSNITFCYKKYDEYENLIARIKRQQDVYYKNVNSGEYVINCYNDINVEAA